MENKNIYPPYYYNICPHETQKEKSQSLQEKTGASAEEIRKAIEKLGFDRIKVEEYLTNK